MKMATMAETRARAVAWESYAPLSGVLAVIGWVVGAILLDTAMTEEDGAALLAAFNADETQILVGAVIWLIGTALFIWFLGSLRSRLLAAEGGDARLTTLAFAGGIATAVCLALIPGGHAAGALSNEEIDESAALALGNIGDAFFLAAEYLLPVLLIASALVALRYAALPRWLAWIQIIVAIVLLIGPIGWAALLFAFPIWVVIVSLLLWRTTSSAPGRPVSGAPLR
jgi:hypothetical protein